MKSVQLHLALTHVPVIISILGMLMLAIALLIKNTTVIKTSYALILIAGIAAIPVYLTGEGAEHTVEKLAGVSESIIEEHEEIAKMAMLTMVAAGLAALVGLFSFNYQRLKGAMKIVVLVLTMIAAGLMAQTAHLGGQVRHTEMKNDVVNDEAHASYIPAGEAH